MMRLPLSGHSYSKCLFEKAKVDGWMKLPPSDQCWQLTAFVGVLWRLALDEHVIALARGGAARASHRAAFAIWDGLGAEGAE